MILFDGLISAEWEKDSLRMARLVHFDSGQVFRIC